MLLNKYLIGLAWLCLVQDATIFAATFSYSARLEGTGLNGSLESDESKTSISKGGTGPVSIKLVSYGWAGVLEEYVSEVRGNISKHGDLKAYAFGSGERGGRFSPIGGGEIRLTFSESYFETFYPTEMTLFPKARVVTYDLSYVLAAPEEHGSAAVLASVTDYFGKSEGFESAEINYQHGINRKSQAKSAPLRIKVRPQYTRPSSGEFDPTPIPVTYSWTVSLVAQAESARGIAKSNVGNTLKFTSITDEDGVTPESLGIVGAFASGNLSPNQRPSVDAGDFNEDGVVNSDDLLLWSDVVGSDVTENLMHSHGDANGDQVVDGIDFLIWQREFGKVSQVTGVPEPAIAPLLIIAAVLNLVRIRSNLQRCGMPHRVLYDYAPQVL